MRITCQRCQSRTATIHITKNKAGGTTLKLDLCEICANAEPADSKPGTALLSSFSEESQEPAAKMTCDLCKKEPALIHITQRNLGFTTEIHVCLTCACAHGLDASSFNLAEMTEALRLKQATPEK